MYALFFGAAGTRTGGYNQHIALLQERERGAPRYESKRMQSVEGVELRECRCSGEGNDGMNDVPEGCAGYFKVWFGSGVGNVKFPRALGFHIIDLNSTT